MRPLEGCLKPVVSKFERHVIDVGKKQLIKFAGVNLCDVRGLNSTDILADLVTVY